MVKQTKKGPRLDEVLFVQLFIMTCDITERKGLYLLQAVNMQ